MSIHRSRPRWRAWTAGTMVVLTTACRSYAPIDSQAVRPGTAARIRLTDRGSVDLAALIGPRGQAIEGRVVQQDSTGLLVAVTSVTRVGGDEEPWLGERVPVSRAAIADVGVPQLARGRSALLFAGLAAGLVAIGAVIGGTKGEGGIRVVGPPSGQQ